MPGTRAGRPGQVRRRGGRFFAAVGWAGGKKALASAEALWENSPVKIRISPLILAAGPSRDHELSVTSRLVRNPECENAGQLRGALLANMAKKSLAG